MGHILTAAKVSSHRAVTVGYIHGTACVVLYMCAWKDCESVRLIYMVLHVLYCTCVHGRIASLLGYIHGTACVVLYMCAWKDCESVRFYSVIMLAA